MQSFSSRIWTRAAVSISYGDNDYTTGTAIDKLSIIWKSDLFDKNNLWLSILLRGCTT